MTGGGWWPGSTPPTARRCWAGRRGARLRAKPVGELLQRESAGRYPHGLAAAVLLALDAVRAGDGTRVCGAVMDLVAVLSPAGVPRVVLNAAGQAGALSEASPVPAEV